MSSVKRQQTTDRFPILETNELSVCLKSLRLMVNEQDLIKPTPIFIQSLFQQILETFLFIDFKNVQKTIAKNNQDDEGNGDGDEDEDSLFLLTLYKLSFGFINDCGVYDFTLTDLIKPDGHRSRRFLSAIVNFARFREEHLYDNESIIQKNNLKFEKYHNVLKENKNLNKEISEFNIKNANINQQLHDLNQHNSKVESELKNLKKIQESLTNQHLTYKNEKFKLIQQLEDNNYLLLESKKDLAKMKNYIIEKPEIISKIINDMNNSLLIDQKSLNDLELRSRNLAITIESFNLINQDLKSCLKLIEDLNLELNKENLNVSKLNELNEIYDENQLKLNEFDRKVQLLKRQIKIIQDKTQRINEQKSTKLNEYEAKMTKLHEFYTNLMVEKNLNDKSLSKRKEYIQSVQKKMNDLENEFKREFDETNLEIQRLNSHVKMYLNQIEEKLNL